LTDGMPMIELGGQDRRV